MTGKTHSLVGLTGAIVVSITADLPLEHAAIVVVGAVVTAKTPDVDIKIPALPHRGPATHSLLSTAIFVAAVTLLSTFAHPHFPVWLIAVGVGVGIGLHVLADAMTVSGVPLLWPLVRSDVHALPGPLRVTTGKFSEAVFVVMLQAALIGYLYLNFHGRLLS